MPSSGQLSVYTHYWGMMIGGGKMIDLADVRVLKNLYKGAASSVTRVQTTLTGDRVFALKRYMKVRDELERFRMMQACSNSSSLFDYRADDTCVDFVYRSNNFE